jgi:hypothetical protein
VSWGGGVGANCGGHAFSADGRAWHYPWINGSAYTQSASLVDGAGRRNAAAVFLCVAVFLCETIIVCQDRLGTHTIKKLAKEGVNVSTGSVAEFTARQRPHMVLGPDGVTPVAVIDDSFAPFLYKNDNFTKTGSGQTYGNSQTGVFLGDEWCGAGRCGWKRGRPHVHLPPTSTTYATEVLVINTWLVPHMNTTTSHPAFIHHSIHHLVIRLSPFYPLSPPLSHNLILHIPLFSASVSLSPSLSGRLLLIDLRSL